MTLTLAPTTPTNLPLTSRDAALRAVNQLLSVVVGRDIARATDNLKHQPADRVKEALALTVKEYQDAVSSMATDPNGTQKVKQVQRKLDSLSSLQVLSNVLNEVDDW